MADKRATAAEKERRVNEVYKRLVGGMPKYDLLRFIAQEFGVKKRMAELYIADATAILVNESAYQRPAELGRAIARLNTLYSAAMRVQDHARALAAQREINKLMSLYAPEQPKTVLFGELDPALMATLTDALSKHGLSASDVFEAMLAELSVESEMNNNE